MSELLTYFSSHFWSFLFVFLRLSSLFIAFPFISGLNVPLMVRVVLVLAFSFFVSSFVTVEPGSLTLFEFALAVLKELLLGLSLALVVYIFYAVFLFAADQISYLMGLTVVNMFDPTFGMVSVLGRFFVYVFYALFFATGAYRLFIGALVESFKLIPPGGASFKGPLFKFLFQEAGLIFSFGFQMAFPFLLVLFITNLALALVNRLIPQINVFIVGLPLQLFVGLVALSVGFSVVVLFGENLIQRLVEDLITLLRLTGGG
ncbi:flagellar biosynthetic protein FliR [Thermovibrio ammonificans]|jgi:flagellar biosynthetic protein FliR